MDQFVDDQRLTRYFFDARLGPLSLRVPVQPAEECF